MATAVHRFPLHLPQDLFLRAKHRAVINGLSMTKFIEQLIEKELDKEPLTIDQDDNGIDPLA